LLLKDDTLAWLISRNYYKLRTELIKEQLKYIRDTLKIVHDSTVKISDNVNSISYKIPEIYSNVDIIKERTQSLYDRYISYEVIPDDSWRIYAGYNYGFKNRPHEATLFEIGVKSIFINEKLHFDASIIGNNHSPNPWFEQANFSMLYRLYSRRKPYFSIDVGGGGSYGVKFNRNDGYKEKAIPLA
jgi:hypothetical protein